MRRSALLAACGGLGLCLAGAAVIATSPPAPRSADALPARPQRIMSTNLCSDLLLLMLVPKDRIASVTYLAHDAAEALIPGADEGVPTNRGTAEEVVQQQPDLILASPWSAAAMRRLAHKVGAPVVEIDSANSFADIRRITRQIGALVGEPQRAEALIAGMDRKLADLARQRPTRPIRVVAWSAADAVPGRGTLTDDIIRAAGAINIAATIPDGSSTSFSLEELLAARPDAIMRGESDYGEPSLADAASEHPLVRTAFKGRRIAYPTFLHTCGLPQSADSAVQLHRALARLPARGVAW